MAEYFSVGLDRGVAVNLHKSVLLENEVLLMVGAAPTSRVVTADGMTASYIFEQVQTATEDLRASKDEEFELRLSIRKRYFNEPEIDPYDQMLFTFAAYSAGPARIRKLRKEAAKQGYDPNN